MHAFRSQKQEFVYETKENHTHHCKLIEIEGLEEHYSTCYGINRDPILNKLCYFDITSGALIPDVMHDILEGVLPKEIKLMFPLIFTIIIILLYLY